MDIWDVAWLAPRPAEESEDVDLRLVDGLSRSRWQRPRCTKSRVRIMRVEKSPARAAPSLWTHPMPVINPST